jgi:hypothetical protein
MQAPNKCQSGQLHDAYVEGGVGAGGVAGGELDASGEVAVPVRVLRLETTPCTHALLAKMIKSELVCVTVEKDQRSRSYHMHGSSDVFVSSETNKQCKVRIRGKWATSITCIGTVTATSGHFVAKQKARIFLSFFCSYRLSVINSV